MNPTRPISACLDDTAHAGPVPAAHCPHCREERAAELRAQRQRLLLEAQAIAADEGRTPDERLRERDRLNREIAPINAALAALREEEALR